MVDEITKRLEKALKWCEQRSLERKKVSIVSRRAFQEREKEKK